MAKSKMMKGMSYSNQASRSSQRGSTSACSPQPCLNSAPMMGQMSMQQQCASSPPPPPQSANMQAQTLLASKGNYLSPTAKL